MKLLASLSLASLTHTSTIVSVVTRKPRKIMKITYSPLHSHHHSPSTPPSTHTITPPSTHTITLLRFFPPLSIPHCRP